MIAVVGSSNTDFSIKVERLPSLGETVLGKAIFVSGGGKGANQAAAIARLGGEVNFISNIGIDYFGNERIKDFKKVGINTKFIKRDRLHNSGMAFILVDKNGQNLITVSPGSNSFLTLDDILKRKECIRRSNILLLQLEIPLESVRWAIYLAKRLDKLIILNPAPVRSHLSNAILSKVDILIPNEVELSMLTSKRASDCHSLNHILRRSRLLLKRGVGCVIITLGNKGTFLVNKKGTKFFRAKKVRVVDTTCAGDAFCGAFAFGLDRKKSIEEAIEFANSVAALTCTKLGAQSSLPSLKEVKCSFKER